MDVAGLFDDPTLRHDLARVDARLRAHVDMEDPFLSGVLSHLVNAGGKRIRPVLTLLSAYAVAAGPGEADDRVVDAATAVELLHLGSLYHDDVLDEALERRGVTSVNAQWGNAVAVLGGDRLLALSAEISARLGQAEAAIMAACLAGLCEGQMRETRTTFLIDRDENEYLRSISGKTATLFGTACRLGALEAGAGPPAIDRLATFGHELGMAFQIVDDILDLVADADTLGKPAGNDLVAGVYTLPVLHARRADPAVARLLASPMTPEVVAEVRARAVAAGSVDDALDVARSYAAGATQALEGGDLTPAGADTLRELPSLVLQQLQAVGTGGFRPPHG